MKIYTTKYAVLHGISEYALHKNGNLMECVLNDRVELATTYGKLIPQYDFLNQRKKNNYCLTFYENGSLRRISLNSKTDIETPLGVMSAELITFYESGAIKRLFPLNGQLSAYWEENDEYQLAEEMSFEFPFGHFKTKIIAISFYEDGNIKDFTLWPKEEIIIHTPLGECPTRIGLSLYSDGGLQSIEPARSIEVQTPIGVITAYDMNANGICGDKNSLIFTPEGKLKSLISSSSKVIVYNKENVASIYSPEQNKDIDGLEISFIPLSIEFKANSIIINNKAEYDLHDNKFIIEAYLSKVKHMCSDCSSCGQCGNNTK